MRRRIYFCVLAIVMMFAQSAFSQASLASRVLIVYDPSSSDSVAVAAHYQAARGVPAANLCPITMPGGTLTYSLYVSAVKTPVRACLNSVGPQSILYILLAYPQQQDIQAPSGQIYSLDSFLADIWDQYTTQFFEVPPAVHRYYAESQSQGNAFVPFQSLANYRNMARAQLIYSVWRLDGASAAIANAQVDNATAAMAAGGPPISQVLGSPANACVDLTYGTVNTPVGDADSGYATANWDLYRISQMLTTANNFNVITDFLSTNFGTAPSPNCPNTGLYVGWYNYGDYNNAFSWDQGAIGWDLDSGALVSTRSGPWWGTGAIAAGITVTSGPITEPYLEGLARPAVVRNLLEGANVGDAFLRNTRWLKWMITNVGDPLYQPFPGGVAPFNAPLAANSMAVILNQSTFREYVGGTAVAANITVSSPAPTGGLNVTLTQYGSGGLTFPTSATIPAGETSVTVIGSTTRVASESDVQVVASAGSVSSLNTFSVYPLLSGVDFTNSSVQGGGTIQAFLGLNGNAPLGGAQIQLSSDTPAVVALPATITIPAGLAEVTFNIATTAVATSTNVNITSTYAGASNTVTLTITP